MKKLSTGLSSVNGYNFSAIECGIRYENRLDLSFIYSEKPCNASGMFTTNRVYAAPVRLCRERINGKISGILINATNANACTGEKGYNDAVEIVSGVEKSLSLPSGSILMASTGIIGRLLPVNKILGRIGDLVSAMSKDKAGIVPKAIMTTDKVPKEAAYSFETSKGTFHVAGTCKGSGMIAPEMDMPHATMLAFMITDAPVEKTDLDKIFERTVKKSFNALTIDGDMSTNDTALIMAPSQNDNLKGKDLDSFEEALFAVLYDLSVMLIKDGEGATKCVTINVINARTVDDAKKIAKSVAESLLVKTAIFGGDPNWGRVACAAGYAGVDFDMQKLSVSFGDMALLKNGEVADIDKGALAEFMKRDEYGITVDIASGESSFSYLTTDISYEYVKINAEYST